MALWDGYRWRKEYSEDIQAYFTARSISVHTQNPISAKELIEPLRQSSKQQSKLDDEQYLKETFKNKLKKIARKEV